MKIRHFLIAAFWLYLLSGMVLGKHLIITEHGKGVFWVLFSICALLPILYINRDRF